MKIGAIVFVIGAILIFASIVGFYYILNQAGNKTVTYSLSLNEVENKTIELKKNVTYQFSFSADYPNVSYAFYSPSGKKIVEGSMSKNSSFKFKSPSDGNYILSVKNMGKEKNRVAVIVLKSGEIERIHNMMLQFEIMFIAGAVAAVAGIAVAMIMRK